MLEKLPFMAAAVVIWLPKGEQPTSDDFAVGGASKSPPHPNPEAWWELHQAIVNSVEAVKGNHDKLPWIKVGERVLAPEEVGQAYQQLRGESG